MKLGESIFLIVCSGLLFFSIGFCIGEEVEKDKHQEAQKVGTSKSKYHISSKCVIHVTHTDASQEDIKIFSIDSTITDIYTIGSELYCKGKVVSTNVAWITIE